MIMGESDSKSNNFKVQNQVRNSFALNNNLIWSMRQVANNVVVELAQIR